MEASAWALDTINGSPFYRKVSKAIDEIKINGSPIKNGRKRKINEAGINVFIISKAFENLTLCDSTWDSVRRPSKRSIRITYGGARSGITRKSRAGELMIGETRVGRRTLTQRRLIRWIEIGLSNDQSARELIC